MKILYCCTTWGQKASNWDGFFSKISENGYDAVETDVPAAAERGAFLAGLEKYKLQYIGQHWETATAFFDTHKNEYEERLHALAELKPLLINAHTGKDYFSFAQNCELLNIAQKVATETGIRIVHETHRGRFAFAAHVTKRFLDALPGLNLTFDVSHWCNVAESLLEDQVDAVALAIERAAHVHARVGFTQGPQVADPAKPQYEDALAFHLGCWDRIVARHKAIGSEFLTITPEFGPAPYMPGDQPATAQWNYNLYMMNLLKSRYAS